MNTTINIADVLPGLYESDRAVLKAMYHAQPRQRRFTRSELVRLSALPRTTIYDALVRLRLMGLVTNESEDRKRRGHPKTYYRLL